MKEISDYIFERSPLKAPRFLETMVDSIESLEVFPHRYRVAYSKRVREGGVRILPLSSYLVYYRIVEEQKAVRVLGIRHGARRRPKRL